MKMLTPAEEQVMQLLWKHGKAMVKDLLADMPEPRPAYNTVSTIVRILEKKGFVGHKAYGKTHEYFPAISKDAYRKFSSKQLISKYFKNSVGNLVSFFASSGELTEDEIIELEKLIKEHRS